MHDNPTPAIEIAGLHKRYGDQTVLADLNLTVPAGTVTALLGPNGAGKTTTVSILATLLPPDGGTARVLGHDVVDEAQTVRRLIGVTGQLSAVDPTGLNAKDFMDALNVEYKQNDIFPPNDITEDWLKLVDYDPENVVKLSPVKPRRVEQSSII